VLQLNFQIKSFIIGIFSELLYIKFRFINNVDCSTTSDYVLRAVPQLSPEYEAQAESITTQFTGDPSYMAYNGATEEEPEDPEAPPVERFREVHRVSYVVKVR
jgi:hypothetical protein